MLVAGIIIPRDASKQAMKTYNQIPATALLVRAIVFLQLWCQVNSQHTSKPGDLLFLGIPFSSTDHVHHVMMLHSLTPVPTLVESADNSTRIVTIEENFGAPLDQLKWGAPAPGGIRKGITLTWGTFYPKKMKI